MALDSMRLSGGRCPPLIVTILLLACFLLIFNWWSLSTENVELMSQLDQLQDQLKITVEERDKCFTVKGNIEQQYKNSESEVGVLHVRLQKQNELKKINDELTDDVTICKSELDSLSKLDVTKTATLEAQRLEKDRLTSQLDTKREETLKLISELNKTKADLQQLKQTCNKYDEQQKVKENLVKDVNNMGKNDEMANGENDMLGTQHENVAGANIQEQITAKSVSQQFANGDGNGQ